MSDPQKTQAVPSIWQIMNPVRGKIYYAMVLSALASLATVLALIALAWEVHLLLVNRQAFPWQPLAAAAVFTALAYVLRLLAFNQSHYAAFRLETVLRKDLSDHLAQVPLGYVQQNGAAGLAKVMMDDVKNLHAFVADSTPLYARAYVSPVLTFIALFILDWRLALAATAVLVVGLGIIARTMRNSGEVMHEFNLAREQVSVSVVEYVQAMPVVRTFDSGTATFGRYQRALQVYLDIVLNWYRMAGFPARFSQVILNPMPTVAVMVWLGGWLVTHDALAVSTWVAVLLICTGMAESLLPLMSLKHLIARTEISVHRINEVMSQPALPEADADAAQMPVDASVRFEQVGFRYTADGAMVLQDISFTAAPGTITALVGPSGAGKTTVARLIPRFWDVSEGTIFVGGADIRKIRTDVLMQQVAFVFQDTFLFADTIAANIRLGLPDATDEDVIAAAKAAQAHEFIMELPSGYNTLTGERGVFLSGGQRQRITIARAILQNRPILVLDEATAFADPENEAALLAALSHLMRGKTVLMIAHRLSTIRDADQILVFDHGRLSEKGRHDQLVANGAVYARLWGHYEKAQGWALMGDRK
ncbi:ABC transporter ATP-binding protein [Brucella sp. TWI559]